MQRRYVNGSIAGLMIAAIAALACSSSKSTGPGSGGGHSTTITASGSGGGYGYGNTTYSFSPTPDTVPAGTTMSFVFEDVTHTVIFDTQSMVADSIPPSTNTTVTRTFSTAGTFNYHCRIHSYMTGVVVVQ